MSRYKIMVGSALFVCFIAAIYAGWRFILNQRAQQAEALFGEAIEALNVFDYDRAIRAGQQLKDLQHSAAFEVLARAYNAQEQYEEALTALREGVQAAPDAWPLWTQLGETYCHLKRYRESYQAYEHALTIPGADQDFVRLNLAVTQEQAGQYEEALATLSRQAGQEYSPQMTALKMSLLNRLERYSDTRKLGMETLSKATWDTMYSPQLAAVHAKLGVAIWEQDHDAAKAGEYAWKAIALNKSESSAAYVIRESNRNISPNAHRMTVTIMGRWSEPFAGEANPPGFVATYEVVADSAGEALNMIRPFEPAGVRDSLEVQACKVQEAVPNHPKGVYTAHPGYSFFPYEEGQ